MIVYDHEPFEAYEGPVDDAEEWETAYASDYDMSQEDPIPSVKPSNIEADALKAEQLLWLAEVLNDGKVTGEGTGNEVVGVVAGLLENDIKYGFEFNFYRLLERPEEPELD